MDAPCLLKDRVLPSPHSTTTCNDALPSPGRVSASGPSSVDASRTVMVQVFEFHVHVAAAVGGKSGLGSVRLRFMDPTKSPESVTASVINFAPGLA